MAKSGFFSNKILLEFTSYSRTMVFCYQNCSDLLWEKIVLVIEKNWGWRPRIFKIFEVTRTIYSNSERSEQFLVNNIGHKDYILFDRQRKTYMAPYVKVMSINNLNNVHNSFLFITIAMEPDNPVRFFH